MSSVAFQISAILRALGENVLGAEDRAIILHGALHAQAQFRGGYSALGLAIAIEAGDRCLAGIARQIAMRRIGLNGLGAFKRDGAAEDNEIDQRIGAQAIGAVYGNARRLADRE